jgi:uncharacterized phage infection (PIP) family protein YhgE
MSIRSHAQRINTFNASAAPSNPIDFRDDFVNSTAVYAANTDETVSQIMQRLDQLQSKIGANEAAAATPAAPRAAATSSSAAARTPSTDLHARVATLESVHEDTLRSLGVKLDGVERKLNEQREVESLMGQISSKFSRIETQLGAAKESEGLMTKVASKFSAVETRLQSAMQMGDRVAQLESRLEAHSDLHSRMSRLESRLGSHAELHSRVNRLEASMAPDPEQERLITRISAKLDSLERARGGEGEAHNLGAQSYRPTARSGEREDAQFLGASADDREGRINYLQSRIEKLKELRSRYEAEEAA